MRVAEFHFDLPEELIAQAPPNERGASRMLVLGRESGTYRDEQFAGLPEFLRAGDLLVLNDSRVIPARLFAVREGTTGKIEILLTQQLGEWEWSALVRPGRKVHSGTRLEFDGALRAEVVAEGEFGERTLRLDPVEDFLGVLDRIGHMPLPPYIHREDVAEDRSRYQTVYAAQPGSAAAPTAGLHFTPEMLERLQAKGVEIATVTLHVGLGTFQPVRAEVVEEIKLHSEHYTLPAETAEAVNRALREGRRVIAAGTTTTRTLEHCARIGKLEAHSGETSIFISPGHEFRVVSGLLTNFHLPESTLLMLVSAFAGREHVLAAYTHAVAERYRFFSYGDCMLAL